MELKQLLEDIKLDTQDHLNEDVVKKRGKYFIVKHFNGDPLPGAREEGYRSLEAAAMEMLALTKGMAFRRLPFEKKKDKVDKYIEKWNKDNGVKEKKGRRQSGFETYK